MIRVITRRLRRDDAGLSMTELLVASMLTLLVLVMVGNMFISVTKITTASNQTRASTDVATNVVNEVTSVVRVSTDLIKADDTIDYAIQNTSNRNRLIIFSMTDTVAAAPAPSKITFELVAAPTPQYPAGTYEVKETSCLGTQSSNVWVFTTPCETRTLGTGVLYPDSVSNQLFTYRDVNGNVIPNGTSDLTTSQRDQVASIVVTVRALAPTSKNGSILVTNTVVLRNLGLDTPS